MLYQGCIDHIIDQDLMLLPQAHRTLVKISIHTCRFDVGYLAGVCTCKTQSEVHVISQLDSPSVRQSVNNNHSTGDLDSFMPHSVT